MEENSQWEQRLASALGQKKESLEQNTLPELKKLAECGDPLVEKHADDAIKAIEK